MKSLFLLYPCVLISSLLLAVGPVAFAGEEKAEANASESASNADASNPSEKEESTERKTLKIERKPLEISFESDGVFVAREMAEIRLEPESWSEFKIEEIVPHGAKVHKGEVVVRFDGKELKESLDDLELELRLGELAIIKAEQELPRLEKSIRDTYEQAERTLSNAQEDHEHYQTVGRDMMLKGYEMSLKSTEQRTESAREELRQLTKMYEADDLTEDTEEIILTRQRAAVEQAEFYLEQAQIRHARSLEVSVPRNDIQEKEAIDQAETALERAKTAMETDLNRVRYDLEKSKRDRVKSLEKHAKLTRDLGLLAIKAPADGVVFYGECSNGKWSKTADLIESLQVKGSAKKDSVLMTIVGPDSLYVISSVEEKNRPSVEVGQSATIQPTATDSAKLKATISELSGIPVDDDEFAMELKLREGDLPNWLVAGMTGKAKVTTYTNAEAIVIPKKAVHEGDDEEYVWIIEDDVVKKQLVTTGRTNGDDVEVTDGLDAGDVISLDDE